MAKINQEEWNVLHEVSARLSILDPQWLYDLINFESNWNPQAKNLITGNAKGLIQWIDSTARDMGYANSQEIIDKYPDRISQLRYPVVQYLRRYAPFNTEQSLYMAVFYPVARHWDPDTTFQSKMSPAVYAKFKHGNPGIETVRDYMNFLKKKPVIRAITKIVKKPTAPLLIIAILAAAAYFYLKRR